MTAIKAVSNSHRGKQRKVPTGRSSKWTRLCPLTRTPFAPPLSHETPVSPPSATEQTNPLFNVVDLWVTKSGPQHPTPHGNWLPRPTTINFLCRRRPTLPHPPECSTIGAGGLSFRVRNGTGRDPTANTTDKNQATTIPTTTGGWCHARH